MTTARKHLVASDQARFYHITTRCVRRAFLCGDAFEHRKDWVYRRLRFLADLFPVSVAGYAVMSNHLHLVVRYDPTATAEWSADTVYDRWFTLRGRLSAGAQSAEGATEADCGAAMMSNVDDAAAQEHRQRHTSDADWVARTREKLGSLGWFMRELKHFIALRANQEDGCKGHFWEARYYSQPLLDQAALAACMVYVDLNPIRAQMAETPESSAFVSVQERIQARTRRTTHPQPGGRWRAGPEPSAKPKPLPKTPTTTPDDQSRPAFFPTPDGRIDTCVDEAHPNWLLPLRQCVISEWPVDTTAPTPAWISRDRYLQLVDETGRCIRAGKRGAIPQHLADILHRLDLEPVQWLAAMSRGGSLEGSALGAFARRQSEAARRGLRWLANRCRLFSDSTARQVSAVDV